MTSTSPIVIRRATPGDAAALERLARLDSQRLPAGPHLVALADDQPVAAISLANGRWVADPFVAAEPVVALLRQRTVDLTGRDRPRRRLLAPSFLRGLHHVVPRGV
jgi:hypothetical protein